MQDCEKPTWGFTHNNGAGNISTKSFQPEDDTWTGVLQEFIYFLRGLGYHISADSIAINSERHILGDEWLGGYYAPEVEQNEDDWKHPDDFYPLFEGEPKECAFEPEPVVCSLEDFIRALGKQKGE